MQEEPSRRQSSWSVGSAGRSGHGSGKASWTGWRWAGEDLWSTGIQLLHFGSEETEAMVTKPVSVRSQAQVS